MRSSDDARTNFGYLFDAIFDAVTEGVRDYYRDHPSTNHTATLGSGRRLVRNHIAYRLRSAIAGINGVSVSEKPRTTDFGMYSGFLSHVHTLSRNLIAAFGHTSLPLSFRRNGPASALFGWDFHEVACLTIGYVSVPGAPMDPRVFVTYPLGRRNVWIIELQGSNEEAIVPSLPDGDRRLD